MLDIRAKHTKNVHSLLGLALAMHAMPFLCLSCGTGATNSVLLGLMALLWVQKPLRASSMAPIAAPNFLLDTALYEVSTPSKTLGILKCPDVRNEGQPEKKCPKSSVAGGGKPQNLFNLHLKF